MPKNKLEARTVAVAAIMIAVVCVFTLAIRVPFAPTRGYFNFSDVAIYFAAFAFGPWIGLIAGGVGAGLADVLGGYALYAPLTFFAHGLEGLVAGYVGRGQSWPRMLLGWALGAIVMLGLYFIGEAFILGMGVGAAAAEALSVNIPQVVAGGVVGIPLVFAVRRAYPPIARIGR